MGVTICSSSSPAQRMNPAGAELWVFFKGQAKNKVRVVTVTMCEYLLQLRDATKCCMFLCVLNILLGRGYFPNKQSNPF